MEKKRSRLASLAIILVCLFSFLTAPFVYGQDQSRSEIAEQKAKLLLDRLSPEERIGQLFLVTMDGLDINEDSEIFNLITNYHISGVVLRRENDNFTDQAFIEEASNLIGGLQEIEYQSRNDLFELEGNGKLKEYVPLFIGISQSGDLFPTDQIITRLTPLPSQMAIGATWDTSLANEAGFVLGKEITSLGFNMIFGPSLDVIENPYVEGKGDLGVRTFGGDPFWVGEFGSAFIDGLHQGGNNKLAVIAKNFPGRGSSDRLPDEDVATVRKSLEQLKLIELAPFITVTDINNSVEDEIVDGLLLSHIRYQGFQGNIRATTRPVSFDQAAVDLLMGLQPFSFWRGQGGILVSDDLGSQAVRKFFSPEGQSFDGRQISRNAFLSGNDLLYMDQLISTNDADRFVTYIKSIEHFIQKYREDKSFADRVDDSVLRILTLKFKMYPEFTVNQVFPDKNTQDEIGMSGETVFNIISRAASLISPKREQLSEAIPEAPSPNERIVIFTDSFSASQCVGCAEIDMVSFDGLQRAIIKFFGPAGSGQIFVQNLTSYTFNDLQDFIENPYNRADVDSSLSRANWVIFIIHDQNTDRLGANALHNLLAEKPESIRNKNVVVFALNAPYYYDATEISAFSAYYALFSKSPASFEVAARILFQELNPIGSSPVSIPGIAYNLITATSPNPDQVIELFIDIPAENGLENGETQDEIASEDLPEFTFGENLPVRTGVIVDQNNNPVPDGTVVRFTMNLQGESLTVQQVETTTTSGIARASFRLQYAGLHEIRVISEPALNSQIMVLDISEEKGAIISAITPTPIPTIPVVTESVEEEIPVSNITEEIQKNNNSFLEWVAVTFVSWACGIVFFYTANFVKISHQRLKIACGILMGGLVMGYWLILDMPGSFPRYGLSGYISLTIYSLMGAVIAGYLVWLVFNPSKSKT